MYTNEMYKIEIERFIKVKGYNSSIVAQKTFDIFLEQGGFVDKNLYNKLIYIFTMEEGPEFEMTEKQFYEFLEKM
jgi:hypothetical protein